MTALVSVEKDRPLATAAWGAPKGGGLGPYRKGAVLLGYADDGLAVGLRDDRHVLVAGGTRGGKGTSVVVPNLLTWPGSAVVIDPKGENATVTARRRGGGSSYCHGMGQRVVLLDPMNAAGSDEDDLADLRAAYNPLDLIDPARPETMDEAWRIADAIVISGQAGDPYWEADAKALIRAVILHVAASEDCWPSERNLITVRRLLVAGDEEAQRLAELAEEGLAGADQSSYAHLFRAMRRNRAFGGVIAQAGVLFGHMEAESAKTFIGVSAMARVNTDFIDSPGMQACLSRSDFALSDLKTDPKGMSVYLSLPQRYIGTHFRWLRMMTTLAMIEMERTPGQPASGHPVLAVLDEFPALGRMQVVEHAAAQIAGYGVKLMFVVQTLAQLKDVYKDNWETLVAAAGVRLFFGNDDHFTRDYVSKLIGETEVTRVTRSRSASEGSSQGEVRSITTGSSSGASWSGQSNGATSYGGSSSTSYSAGLSYSTGSSRSATEGLSETIHKRPLVTPDEVGRLFGNADRPALLALASGHQPVVLARRSYFKLSWMRGLYDRHPDHSKPLSLPALAAVLAAEREAAARQEEESRLAEEREREQKRLEAEAFEELRRQQFEGWRQEAEARRKKILRRIIFFALKLPVAILIVGTIYVMVRLFMEEPQVYGLSRRATPMQNLETLLQRPFPK